MTSSAFGDKTTKPVDRDLAKVLGPAAGAWHELRTRIGARYAPLAEEWVYSGKQYGWSLRLKQKQRAVLYMTPLVGRFRASFALGEKAAAATRGAGLPKAVLEVIAGAPKYAEGRAVRLEVRTLRDVGSIVRIAEIKMEN